MCMNASMRVGLSKSTFRKKPNNVKFVVSTWFQAAPGSTHVDIIYKLVKTLKHVYNKGVRKMKRKNDV